MSDGSDLLSVLDAIETGDMAACFNSFKRDLCERHECKSVELRRTAGGGHCLLIAVSLGYATDHGFYVDFSEYQLNVHRGTTFDFFDSLIAKAFSKIARR